MTDKKTSKEIDNLAKHLKEAKKVPKLQRKISSLKGELDNLLIYRNAKAVLEQYKELIEFSVQDKYKLLSVTLVPDTPQQFRVTPIKAPPVNFSLDEIQDLLKKLKQIIRKGKELENLLPKFLELKELLKL